MDDLAFARSLHVVAVILWMGGVGFVTTVLLPAIRRLKAPEERVAFFDAIERRFAGQARVTTLIAGGSGFYMTGGSICGAGFQIHISGGCTPWSQSV